MRPQDQLIKHFRIDEAHRKALKRLGIETVLDLLYHLPARYEDISKITSVGGLQVGEDAVVYGRVSGLKTRKTWKSRRAISEGYVEDGSARIKIMWFNQPYIAKMLADGVHVKLAGRVSGTAEKPYLSNPEIEIVGDLPIDQHDSLFKRDDSAPGDETLYPVYRETKGVTSKWPITPYKNALDRGSSTNSPIPSPKRS